MFKPVFIRVWIAFIAVEFAAGSACATESTSPDVRAQMIRLVGEVEAQPYAADSLSKSNTVMSWLTEAPDITVTMCAALYIDFDKLAGDDGALLVTQLPIEEARFILEHPEQANDSQAVHLAGLEGMLRMYAAMKTARPSLSLGPLEKIVRFKNDGKLGEFVARAVGRCG